MYKGSGVLFFQNTQGKTIILLGKRSIKPNINFWSVPGGKMDKKDKQSFYACAIREAKEEVFDKNIQEFKKIENLKYVTKSNVFIPYIFQFKTFFVDVSDINLTFSNNWEFSELKWFNIKSLPKKTHFGVRYSLLIFKIQSALKYFKEKQKL